MVSISKMRHEATQAPEDGTYLLSNNGRCICHLSGGRLRSEQSRKGDGGVGPVGADDLIFELLLLQGRGRRRDGGSRSSGDSDGSRLRL